MQRLKGQTALVTGGNSGIGKGIVEAFAREGANVVINYVVHDEVTTQMVQQITVNGGNAIGFKADVSNEAEVQEMFRQAIAHYGTIDILVNNAGLQRDAPFTEMTIAQWQTVMNVNLTGYFLCAREAAKEFIHRGVVPERSSAAGKIICISSVHEMIPWAGHADYASSKGGISMFMKTIAQELASQKIRVNGIAPGA
ncbi:MAG TPA: SDR family NAD(P)-dependent oxidoreductase, partial [Ginsengibacter sp.]|nr:SDR family NAD(P)-dependent oxidoreductase [Ginsengibacter sp.]